MFLTNISKVVLQYISKEGLIMSSSESLEKENAELKLKLENTSKEIAELKESLKKYTNSKGCQRYYESHKEEVKSRAKTYMEKLRAENPEKIKEWRRNAYLRKKAEREKAASDLKVSIETS